jgi:hypothetical protein
MDWSRIRVVYGSTAISEAPSDPFFDKLARKGGGLYRLAYFFSGRTGSLINDGGGLFSC